MRDAQQDVPKISGAVAQPRPVYLALHRVVARARIAARLAYSTSHPSNSSGSNTYADQIAAEELQ